MNDLIDNISKALQFSGDFTKALLNSDLLWKHNDPIAVAHSYERLKSSQAKRVFKELVDEDGKTPEVYDDETLSRLQSIAPDAFKQIKFLALSHEPKKNIHFQVKRPKDFWKKIQDVEHIRAGFDYCEFDKNDDICKVEFELREVIRRQKEVHALKEVGFIWMAITPQDVSKVFHHYFDDNYRLIDGKFHLGWSETLKAINMRYFVCPPA